MNVTFGGIRMFGCVRGSSLIVRGMCAGTYFNNIRFSMSLDVGISEKYVS